MILTKKIKLFYEFSSMSLIWNFFTLSSERVVICKDSKCNFKRNYKEKIQNKFDYELCFSLL
jgi:hypothetical protein